MALKPFVFILWCYVTVRHKLRLAHVLHHTFSLKYQICSSQPSCVGPAHYVFSLLGYAPPTPHSLYRLHLSTEYIKLENLPTVSIYPDEFQNSVSKHLAHA